MNKTNFVQTGGFPLNTERLEELEKAYSIFNAYGALAGDLTIISGCVTTGSNVSDGYVYISGELFPFRAAAVTPTSTVIIVEQKINRPFESSEIKTVHTLRYATFGTAETSWLWSDFARPFETKQIPDNLLTQLQAIGGKAESTTVTALNNKVAALETAISNLRIPKIIVDSDQRYVQAHQSGNNYDNTNKNYIYVYPPDGYTMTNLSGFLPSMRQIKFSGDVDDNDGLWCKWLFDSEKITVICGSVEMREVSQVSYIAVWIKY